METVRMEYYDIIGEHANEAADYINSRESEMIRCGIANDHFPEDYAKALNDTKSRAAKIFGVTYKNWFEQ